MDWWSVSSYHLWGKQAGKQSVVHHVKKGRLKYDSLILYAPYTYLKRYPQNNYLFTELFGLSTTKIGADLQWDGDRVTGLDHDDQ